MVGSVLFVVVVGIVEVVEVDSVDSGDVFGDEDAVEPVVVEVVAVDNVGLVVWPLQTFIHCINSFWQSV